MFSRMSIFAMFLLPFLKAGKIFLTLATSMKNPRIFRFRILALLMLVLAASIGVANAQTFSVLYHLGSRGGDPLGQQTQGTLAQGRDGAIYSTAPSGGAYGAGAIFKITLGGKLSVLHSFDGTDGASPESGLTLGTDGNFYGATYGGGTHGDGTVFKVTPTGTLTVLHNFTGGSDGDSPWGGPIQGTDGHFYGATSSVGGTYYGHGTVYRVTSSGSLTTLHQFDWTHGAVPDASLFQGADGEFYGTTELGGNDGVGTTYRITSAGALTVLHNFSGSDGGLQFAPVVQGANGNFYGTGNIDGVSDVYSVSGSGVFNILHSLSDSDGSWVYSTLAYATDGNLYGTSRNGGSHGCGTIYEVTPTGGFSVLFDFKGPCPNDRRDVIFQHTNGILYGDTSSEDTDGRWSGVFYSFKVGLGPFVSFLPASGEVGNTIEFLGQGFKETTGVSFNGKAAKFKVVSGTYLTATVPKGATSGFVTVATHGGKLKSKRKFRVVK